MVTKHRPSLRAHHRRGLATPVALLLCLLVIAPAPSPARTDPRPNIVLILTDDQRADALSFMPTVQSELVGKGVTFSNGFVVNSLCCPSRVSLLTGRYSYGTGVYRNNGPYGGFSAFQQDGSTIATWLHDSGYQTALIGKYLNGYDDRQATYIPPGWDEWYALAGHPYSYNGFHVSDNGVVAAPSGYQTDVLAAKASDYLRSADPTLPLFLWFATMAPHLPTVPPVRYKGTADNLPPWRPPGYDESDMSDKPAYMQKLPSLEGSSNQSYIDDKWKRTHETLLGVDDAVSNIMTALQDTGRLQNTLIIYTSDNGFLFGEHRWLGKMVPYDESIRVPMILRDDAMQVPPRTDPQQVLNIDVAPTFAAAAGVTPASTVNGRDLLPLVTDPTTGWRWIFLIEHSGGGSGGTPFATWLSPPVYCAVRTKSFAYVEYTTGEEELYDLALDPYELQNVAADPSYAATRSDLQSRLRQLCRRGPPGWTLW